MASVAALTNHVGSISLQFGLIAASGEQHLGCPVQQRSDDKPDRVRCLVSMRRITTAKSTPDATRNSTRSNYEIAATGQHEAAGLTMGKG